MTRRRAPWWMYIVAASFLGYFALNIYTSWLGPGAAGIFPDYSSGRMIVTRVIPNFPGERAGVRAGDRIVAANGVPIRTYADWEVFYANSKIGQPIRMEIERSGQRIELTVTLGRGSSVRDLPRQSAELIALVLALVVAFRRPHDLVARIGAWFLATASTLLLVTNVPLLTWTWRHLPAPLGLLLWIPFVSSILLGGILFTFCAIFPRTLFRARWAWGLVWTPMLLAAAWQTTAAYQLAYHPERVTSFSDNPASFLKLCYGLAGLTVLVVNYRRLKDLNERRRARVLVVGSLVGWLAVAIYVIMLLIGGRAAAAFFGSPLPIVTLGALYLAFPLSFAYAILRHRVFDLGVIVRQGLQYALARRLLVSAMPVLAGILLLDLLLHGDQPILVVFRARGWMYAVLAALAAIAYTRRQQWLEALDRRFFREHYDAQRLLREVVEEVREAQSFERMAPRVVARIEAALHPEFAALLVREPREAAYRTLAAAPAGQAHAPLPAESKLMALVRLLGKPLDVPHTESGWLQQQLPHEETEFLRRTRIDLLVPVATSPERTEALLTLGAKRSEEPYSGEDQDLLVAIAASLAILLEKPPVPVGPRCDVFEECPECGTCYDTGSTRCAQDAAALVPVALPRLLEGRYRVDRRLGRGGMGTVYEAADTALARRVAVKVIREDLVGSAEAAERFRREAHAAASFAHPNVVTVHDFGVAAGTRAFLVMELLQGATLREELRKEKRLAAPRVLSILRGVCAAVEAAHRRQLLHRDLKPENVFLVRGDSYEIAKVLDFGIAKFLPSAAQQATGDTGAGMRVGTLQYMSPEQLRGEPATPAWDLWALAVVAYEMLTGAHPFAGPNPADFEAALLAGRFSHIAVYLPDAPARWTDFFAHALALKRETRPKSARLFFAELEHALSLPQSLIAPDQTQAPILEIAHVLFMDIVSYSKLPMDQQQDVLCQLQGAVRKTAEFSRAEANDQLIRLPTGDGMALVFFTDPEAPVRCALEVGRALRNHPQIKLRMGVHAGPVYRLADINANRNVAGGGINIAQRVMDCGDAGHILLSQAVADVLGQLSSWRGSLHDLGEAEVKHGERVHLFNLCMADIGNRDVPEKLRLARGI